MAQAVFVGDRRLVQQRLVGEDALAIVGMHLSRHNPGSASHSAGVKPASPARRR